MQRCGALVSLLLAYSFLMFQTGCGGSPHRRGNVQGTVTLDKKPLAEGGITFIPTDGNSGPPSVGAIVNGSYSMKDGVVVGKNKVQITSLGKTGQKIPSQTDPKVLIDDTAETLPSRYNAKTELIQDVQPGSNTFDFDLKPK